MPGLRFQTNSTARRFGRRPAHAFTGSKLPFLRSNVTTALSFMQEANQETCSPQCTQHRRRGHHNVAGHPHRIEATRSRQTNRRFHATRAARSLFAAATGASPVPTRTHHPGGRPHLPRAPWRTCSVRSVPVADCGLSSRQIAIARAKLFDSGLFRSYIRENPLHSVRYPGTRSFTAETWPAARSSWQVSETSRI